MKKTNPSDLELIFLALQELIDDTTVPRNVKSKVEAVQKILKEECGLSTRVNKALNELEEIANDTNMQAYTRTQLWNVVSLLEKL
ncbi:MAG: UPF0147 family protein [Candidatus Woesearchaeota archaeon]